MREEPMPEIIAEPQVRGVSSGRRVLVVGAAGNLGRRMVQHPVPEPCRDGVREEPKLRSKSAGARRFPRRCKSSKATSSTGPASGGRCATRTASSAAPATLSTAKTLFGSSTPSRPRPKRRSGPEVGSGRWPASQRWRSRPPAGAGSTFRACRAPTCPMARTSAVSSARPSRGPWSARDPWFRRRKRGSAGSCARRSTWFGSQRRPDRLHAWRRAGPVPDLENPDSDGELRGRRALRRGPSVGRRLCRPPCGFALPPGERAWKGGWRPGRRPGVE